MAIPTELADAFGFTDRIVHAEAEYRKGARTAVLVLGAGSFQYYYRIIDPCGGAGQPRCAT